MRKNVLILTTVSGFLDKFEKDDVHLLQEVGYSVHYAANMEEQHYLFDEQKIREMGVQIHHIDIARSPYVVKKNWRAFFQVLDIIKKYDIDMIHCHTPVGGMIGRMAGRFCKKPIKVIYTAHGFHFYKGAPIINNSMYYLAERAMAHYTDVVVVINEEDYRSAQKFHLKNNGKVYKIPGVGLDVEKFKPMEEEERSRRRKELGISEDEFFLVSVGELNENKNQKTVLMALEKMKKENKLNNIKYGICGDGFYHDKMQTWIKGMGLEGVVVMYGYCKDVSGILGCADASVFPSRREGLGMAGLEALAMGIPLLASDNRGTREYMQHERNGYVFDANDMEGIISGIEKLQKLGENERNDMKRYCRTSIEPFQKKYTDATMETVYRELDKQAGCVYEEKSKDKRHNGGI